MCQYWCLPWLQGNCHAAELLRLLLVRSFDDVRLSGIERGVMGELCTVASSEAKLRSLAKNCLGGGASYNH